MSARRRTRGGGLFAPYKYCSYQTGVTLSQLPVEIYAIFGCASTLFAIPGGVSVPRPLNGHK